MNRLQRRVAAIEALPEADRERLRELMHRGDVLNGCVAALEDAPPIPRPRDARGAARATAGGEGCGVGRC
jgi:hypothetical protein